MLEAGPRGGNVIYVRNGRYIDTRTFVKLVQDGWIGSTGPTTDLISRIVGLVPTSDTGNRIFAVDEPLA